MDQTVLLAHGGGGVQTQELIDRIFKAHFANPYFTADDAAVLPLGHERLAFSTDGFIVSPPFFPGGNIGKLSICGTVNDLACMGAQPLWLTCAFVLEVGFPLADLEGIVCAMAETARAAGVTLVAGDTKVASKGQVDKVFITTSGIGRLLGNVHTSGALARDGDAILVTGDIGRHGAAILLAREEFGIEAEIESDCAPLWHLVQAVLEKTDEIHVIRDATRGGVGTVLYEIASQSQVGIEIRQDALPVDPTVSGICSMLGLDPLYLACEGRLVIIAPHKEQDRLLATLRALPHGEGAACIGSVTGRHKAGSVVVETAIGAKTLLPRPTGELLPRIC